jgi:hypothetical protein
MPLTTLIEVILGNRYRFAFLAIIWRFLCQKAEFIAITYFLDWGFRVLCFFDLIFGETAIWGSFWVFLGVKMKPNRGLDRKSAPKVGLDRKSIPNRGLDSGMTVWIPSRASKIPVFTGMTVRAGMTRFPFSWE